VRWFINGASTAKNYDELMQVFILGMIGARSTNVIRPVFSDDEWKELQMPVLLLIGDHEIMYEATKAIGEAKRRFPNLQAELIRDAGHFLLNDQVQQVNQKVMIFLDTVSSK
jgi:pimeloyl-ACP methyl ester carboxylesterase